ncbi:class I SAM-dependent methyltransferase family protein [Candidatus Bathyarchaeota archaeon]|nr:class I SAM-dependent methyltransferase family protein [Candidatus Bathyarchaeota archaeon]
MGKKLRDILTGTIPDDVLSSVYSSYDIVGDIAIIRLNNETEKYGRQIAEALMKIHRNVKTVLGQISPVGGEYRLRSLKHLAGEIKTKTIHREHGCLFSVDLSTCYFSPRLSYERLRIAKSVKADETIVNMFAGAGCFSIIIAKHSTARKIYSIDINPAAVKHMRENIRLNRVDGKVIAIEGDAKDVISHRLKGKADRVIMPLPEKALQYLPYAVLALKNGRGYIHYYDFEHAAKGENPIKKTEDKVAEKLKELNVTFEIPFGRIVRTTGPNWYQIVLDISVTGM